MVKAKNNKTKKARPIQSKEGKNVLKTIKYSEISFKNPTILAKFLSNRYKILPATTTGVTSKVQKKLKDEVKKARILALLPFTDRHALR